MGCCGDESSNIETFKINGREFSAPQRDEFGGPVRDRVCRDVLILILFVAFCIGGIVYLIVAASKGNVNRLIHGFDKSGNVCGEKNPKWFPNITDSGADKTDFPFIKLPQKQCVKDCSDGSKTFGFSCIDLGTEQSNRILNTWSEQINKYFENTISILRALWGHILAVCVIGLALSILAALLLRFVTAIVIWLAVVIIAVGSIAASVVAWIFWTKFKDGADKNLANGLLAAAIITTIFTVLILILLFAMRNRIRLVIQLFAEAGKAVSAMPQLLFQPLWTLAFLIIVVGVWLAGWLAIESSGDPYIKDTGTDKEVDFKKDQVIAGMRWYHLFGFFWVSQFVIGCQDVVIAGSVSTWYFSRTKSNLGYPVMTSTWRLVRYHLGSVAFGGLIIAIVKMIRFVLKYVEERVAKGSDTLKACLCCCQCILQCFENYLKYLTTNAYIEIAIFGYSFCEAGKKAFNIIANNAMRVTTINLVGDFVLFLVKVAVVIATGFIGWEILKAGYQGKDEKDLIIPMIITVAFTFLIAYCFVSVYEMTVDTLFVCFCEDCEMNDGIEKPYFMSRDLMDFVENSKKAIEALEKRKGGAESQWGPQIRTVMPSGKYPRSPKYPQHSWTDNNNYKTGMTPLHPGYPPISEPPSPSRFLSRPVN